MPQRVAIIHCLGHQKGESLIVQGNRLAYITAKKAALEITAELELCLPDPRELTTDLA